MISACLMVKNEEALLGDCLKSILPFVDEVVLVDTGSQDGTLAVAESFGSAVRVFRDYWKDDFGEMRTHTLELALGNWLLVIDADERFISDGVDGADGLRRMVDDVENMEEYRDIVAFNFLVLNELPGGQKKSTQSIRMFKNGLGFRYVGAIHNQLTYSGNIFGVPEDMRIHHLGYNLSPEKMQEKYRARIGILTAEVRRDPNDMIARFHLVKGLLQRNQYGLARTEASLIIMALRRKDFHFTGTPFNELFQIAGIEKGASE